MNSRNQIVPPPEVLGIFVSRIVEPTLIEVAVGAEKKLFAKLEVWKDEFKCSEELVVVGDAEGSIDCSVRLRFREVFGGGYVLFCEALLPKEQSIANCSGFSLKGELRPGQPPKRTAWTMRYGVWDWTGWR